VGEARAEGERMVVENGRSVSFDYTLTVDGEVVDSSKGAQPLQYTHGEKQIISGLAKQLEGMGVGDEKIVEVMPEEAYGTVDLKAFREVPKTSLPEGAEPEVGMFLEVQGPDGKGFPVKVSEVKENSIVIDFNHPLAGKTLTFDVKVVSVE